MRKTMMAAVAVAIAGMACAEKVQAGEKVEASVGADLVSRYVWRGQDLGGVSVQPTIELGWNGLSLSAWGSVGFTREDTEEIDLTLGYERGGFSVSVTDYWTNEGPGYFHYGARSTSHVFEAQVGYDFGWAALNWYTNFAGGDGQTESGKRAYSSFLSVNVPFALAGIDWNVEVGAVPWATDYYNATDEESSGANGFEVTEVSLQATKELPVTTSFTLPVFARVTWNPATEGAYFVFGLSLGF